jgi:hypothetical protein
MNNDIDTINYGLIEEFITDSSMTIASKSNEVMQLDADIKRRKRLLLPLVFNLTKAKRVSMFSSEGKKEVIRLSNILDVDNATIEQLIKQHALATEQLILLKSEPLPLPSPLPSPSTPSPEPLSEKEKINPIVTYGVIAGFAYLIYSIF